MDAQALQKIISHLISNGPLGELLKGVVTIEEGQIKVVFSGGVEEVNLEQMKDLLDSLSKNIVMAGEEDAVMDIASIGPGVLTVIVKSADGEPSTMQGNSAKTLRDAIDAEWPW